MTFTHTSTYITAHTHTTLRFLALLLKLFLVADRLVGRLVLEGILLLLRVMLLLLMLLRRPSRVR